MNSRILVITFLLFAHTFESAGQNHFFRHYSNAEGLPNSFVYCMNQDNEGYIWIGTPDGIFRFNGLVFEHFTIDDGLASNFATEIFRDSNGRLWFGHQNGMLSLFTGFGFTTSNEHPVSPGMVSDFAEDKTGSIWFCSQNEGLNVIDKEYRIHNVTFPIENETLTQIEFIADDLFVIGSHESLYLAKYYSDDSTMEILVKYETYPGSKVVDIFSNSNDGYIIASLEDGAFQLHTDPTLESYKLTTIDQNMDGELDNLQGGLVDSNGDLWLGVMGNGIFQYKTNTAQEYSRAEKVSTSNGLVSDDIRSVFEDLEGNLWFGLYGDGLLKYVDNNLKFYNYGFEEQMERAYTLTGNSSDFLVVSRNRLLWIDPSTGIVLDTYTLPSKGIGDQVNTVYLANDGTIWLGFEQSGLYILDSNQNNLQSVFISDDELSNSINHITGQHNAIWVSTKKGIVQMRTNGESKKWFSTNDGLPHNNVKQLYFDSSGRILIATLCGMIHYIDEHDQIKVLENSNIGPFNSIVSFVEDTAGSLWVGTYGNGIWRINQDSIYNFTQASGLLSDFCYSLALTKDGQPIIGHTGGISLINLNNYLIRTFSRLEGVKSTSEFYSNSIYADNFGNIWFGTSEGLIKFNSDLSKGGMIPPRIDIISVKVDGTIIDHLKGPIQLKSGRYEISVDYIGLSYTNPEMVFYQTYLEGYNRDWSVPTFNRTVVFERVEHGNYAFKLKAYNENEISSELSSAIEIIIKKPVYLSFWFYSMLVVILGVAIYLVFWILERNHRRVQERLIKNLDEKTKEVIVKEEIIKERKKVEQVLIEAKSKAELSEKLKTSFLQNMSHEIRTPMNAIVGFSELLKEEDLAEDVRDEFIKNVSINAESLLHLIDDILDVSKLETNQLGIKVGKCNLIELVADLESRFLEVMKNQGKSSIKLSVVYDKDHEVEMSTDPARLKQVMMKLLDNAVKFTESGEIRFGYSVERGHIFFFVEDTGIGLSEDQKEVVFDLFRKIEEDKLKLYGGTGLGLTLARYLVNLMGGEIDLESHEGFGSKFFFTLPYWKDSETLDSTEVEHLHDEFKGKFAGKRFLIVEDTDSNYQLIDNILFHTGVKIERAINGEVALQKYFHEGTFDLVIMDIKLPGMDGYEITRLIKEKDPSIPVIAHTAYALEGDREKTLEAGCDGYIPKPTVKIDFLETIGRFL